MKRNRGDIHSVSLKGDKLHNQVNSRLLREISSTYMFVCSTSNLVNVDFLVYSSCQQAFAGGMVSNDL